MIMNSCAIIFGDSIFNSIRVLSAILGYLMCGRKLILFVWNLALCLPYTGHWAGKCVTVSGKSLHTGQSKTC